MISVVMPVRNCLAYTQAAVQSLPPGVQLILIDNASTDGTAEWAATLGPPHVVLTQAKNLGVARSWNLGIVTALSRDATAPVLVMNNDVILAPGALERLLAWHDVGIDVPSVLAIPDRYRLLTWPPQPWVVGPADFCCFMLGNQVIHQVGWFDEGFELAYMEDLDFGLRVLQAGLAAGVCYDALAFHHGSVTISQGGVQHRDAFARNAEYFQSKWGMDYETARQSLRDRGVKIVK